MRGEEYGYHARAEYDLKPGGTYRGIANEGMREHGMPEVAVDGEVLEVDAPRRLVHTWNPMFERADRCRTAGACDVGAGGGAEWGHEADAYA